MTPQAAQAPQAATEIAMTGPAGASAGQAPTLAPADEAAKAIEEARAILAEALADIASDDDDRLAHSLELTAGCTDHVARAIWFLRSAQRASEAP